MKKTSMLALAAAVLMLPFGAQAENIFAGEVTAGQTHVIAAPYGGLVEDVQVRAGDVIQIGDAIATLETTKVYASVEGTVSGVFAKPGDSADGVKERYGALVYIEPVNRFTVDCSTDKAYNSSENRYIHIGETVYLKCTKDGSHQGRGVVTALGENSDSQFTVEVTGGEFYMDEKVSIFRDENYAATSCIGRGTVGRTKTVAVTGEGSVLNMLVKPGDTVERGEALFETVSGVLDGLYAPDKQVVSDISGIVASVEVSNGTSVEKNAKLITVYPLDSMQICILVDEADLATVQVGAEAQIVFSWNADSGKTLQGKVSAISYLNEKQEGASGKSAQYAAYVDFTPDETVRVGMTAVVYVE